MKKPVAKRKGKGFAEGGKVGEKGFESYIEPLARVLTDKDADFGKGGHAGTIMRGLIGPENDYKSEDDKRPHPIPRNRQYYHSPRGAGDMTDSYKGRDIYKIPTLPNFGAEVDATRKQQPARLAKGGPVKKVVPIKKKARR